MPACVFPTRASQFLTGGGELALRIRGREHDGRLIRIRSPKCTIGSAAGCTLRLRAAGIAPLHCWVLRGPSGTVVRRLHGPAQLNGGAFDESPLAPGDRLRLGTVELEVVECNQKQEAAPAELFAVPPADMAELEKELAVALEKIARLEGESRQGWQSSITAADRADQLRTALANAHQQLEDACRELAATQGTMKRQTEELQGLRTALTAAEQGDDERAELDNNLKLENAALRDEQSRCLAELNELKSELAELKPALAGALDERARLSALALEAESRLAAEDSRHVTEEKRLQGELEQYQRRLNQRDAELLAVRDEATTAAGGMTVAMDQLRRTVDMAQVQSQEKQSHWEQQQAALQAELAAAQQSLHEERQSREQQLQQIEQERQARASADQQREALRQELAQRAQELANATARLAEKEADAARCEQLQGELASAQQAQRAAQEQLASLAAGSAAQEALAQQAAELEAARQKLASEQQEAAARLQERHEQLDRRASELEINLGAANVRLAELEDQRAQLAAERDDWNRRAERPAEPAPQAPLVTQPFENFADGAADRAKETNGEELQELQRQLTETETGRRQLAEQVEALELRCRELEEQRRSALAQAAAAYRGADAEAVSESPAPIEDEPPVHMTAPYQPPAEIRAEPAPGMRDSNQVDSVLSRLVQSGVWRKESQEAAESAVPSESPSAAEQQAAVPPQPAAAAPPTAAEHEDESIDNYMDRLLKRVRGESATDAGAWKQGQQPAPAQPSAPVVQLPLQPPGPTPAAEQASDYLPRTTAPEGELGLSAMRDVANDAARTAIETHIRKHTGRQAAGRLFTAALIVAVSCVLGYCAWRFHSLSAGVGSGIGALAGLLSLLAALRRIASVMRLNRPGAK